MASKKLIMEILIIVKELSEGEPEGGNKRVIMPW